MTRRLTLTLVLIFIGYIVHAGRVLAAPAAVCHVERMNKTFIIDSNKIAMYKGVIEEGYRGIASMLPVRTRYSGQGFTKVMNLDGYKYTISINDLKNFSSAADYISIRSRQGHEIIYPISCQ